MFNQRAESMFGYSKSEIIGSPLEALIPDRFRMGHHEHVKRFAAGEETSRPVSARNAAIFGRRKNGEEFPVDAAISKLEIGGETLLTVFLRDISEQKRAEDEERLVGAVGKVLIAAGTDYQRLLTDVANVIVRNHADWCSVDIVQEGAVRRFRVVHRNPALAHVCEALERYRTRHSAHLRSFLAGVEGRPAWCGSRALDRQGHRRRSRWARLGRQQGWSRNDLLFHVADGTSRRARTVTPYR
jgi:PAS domain S-box-containing protein